MERGGGAETVPPPCESVGSSLEASGEAPAIDPSIVSSSLMSVIIESVVRSRPEIEAAFWRAQRTTFAGSMTPALNMSSYSPVRAL